MTQGRYAGCLDKCNAVEIGEGRFRIHFYVEQIKLAEELDMGLRK